MSTQLPSIQDAGSRASSASYGRGTPRSGASEHGHGNDAATPRYNDPQVLQELQRAKEISLNCLSKQERTPRFRRFANGEKLDRFLLAAWAYFEELFRHDGMRETGAPSGGQQGGEQIYLDRAGVESDPYEVQVKMRDMSIAYAGILMKEGGDFGKIHNECVFYEALYDFTARVLNTRFDRRLWSTVECELGRLFRGPGFNLAARKRDPQPTVSSRQLHQMNERRKEMAHLITSPSTAGGTIKRAEKLHGLVARGGWSPMVSTAFLRPRPPHSMTPRGKLGATSSSYINPSGARSARSRHAGSVSSVGSGSSRGSRSYR